MSDDAQVARLELLVIGRDLENIERALRSMASRRDGDGVCVLHAHLLDMVKEVEQVLADLDDPQGVL